MGQVRERNGVKQPETRILDIKYVVRNQEILISSHQVSQAYIRLSSTYSTHI